MGDFARVRVASMRERNNKKKPEIRRTRRRPPLEKTQSRKIHADTTRPPGLCVAGPAPPPEHPCVDQPPPSNLAVYMCPPLFCSSADRQRAPPALPPVTWPNLHTKEPKKREMAAFADKT